MLINNSDKDWEQLGKTDPYFGVITQERYHKSTMTDKDLKYFFHSGSNYINNVISKIREHIDPTFVPINCLDFGCGVGRLVIPLSKVSRHVTGLDVSRSMLNEASKNCKRRGIRNVDFIESDDNLSKLTGKYNFINSFIVFQHIPVKRGEFIFRNLLKHLEKGGVCVLHFTIMANTGFLRKGAAIVKKYLPFGKNIYNIISGKNLFAPIAQVNIYKPGTIFGILFSNNIREFYTEFTDHESYLGMIIFFQKPN